RLGLSRVDISHVVATEKRLPRWTHEGSGSTRSKRRRRLRPGPAPPTWSAHHGWRESLDVFLGGFALAAGSLAPSAVFALAASVGPTRANGAEPGPLSVVQALMDAEHETDLELALSLFAKDAGIVNVVGDTIESAQLRRFLELDMWLNESFALEQATVERNRVTWTKAITAPF